MDIIDVYVIYDKKKYKREDIIKDLREEGYTHNFFISELISGSVAPEHFSAMKNADEVWLFGDCDQYQDYKLARELGKDVWIMK